jgi:hypothetical protein
MRLEDLKSDSPAGPHISQFARPLRSLISTRHICWRWSQDMRARFKTAPPKRDHASKQTEKRLPAQARLTILPGALRSVYGGGFASSPDVSASRLGPRIVNRLQTDYRVECETSGLGGSRSPPADLNSSSRLGIVISSYLDVTIYLFDKGLLLLNLFEQCLSPINFSPPFLPN